MNIQQKITVLCMHIYTYIHTYIHTHIYNKYIYIYIYIYTYIHRYTFRPAQDSSVGLGLTSRKLYKYKFVGLQVYKFVTI